MGSSRSNNNNNKSYWKRRRHQRNKKKPDRYSSDLIEEQQEDGSSSRRQKKIITSRSDLIAYLTEYKEGCVAFYNRVMMMEEQDDGDIVDLLPLPPPPPPTTNHSSSGSGIIGNAAAAETVATTTAAAASTTNGGNDNKDNSHDDAQKDEQEKTVDDHGGNSNDDAAATILIGGVVFPPLNTTSEVFQKPYLELPHQLSKRQRQFVHECCVEVDLFHDSYNKQIMKEKEHELPPPSPVNTGNSNNNKNKNDQDAEEDHQENKDATTHQSPQDAAAADDDETHYYHRHVVISIYGDGFDSIPEWKNQQNEVKKKGINAKDNSNKKVTSLYRYKPWYCRFHDDDTTEVNHHHRENNSTTKEKKDAQGDDEQGGPPSPSSPTATTTPPGKNRSPGSGGGRRVVTFADDTRPPAVGDASGTPKASNQTVGTFFANDYHNSPSSSPIKPSSESSLFLSAKQRQQIEEEGIKAIFALIDQPGDCLRDNLDTLDYITWNGASLADSEPPSSNPSTWMLVDNAAKMRQCIYELELSQPTELAFDVESYNVNKYTQVTCLLQITSNFGKEYVIDTLAPGVWEEVPGLSVFFSDPEIVKIGHSVAGLDARSLHRDFGCFIVNAFDTYEAAKVLELPTHGLAAVCEHYGLTNIETYRELKEQYQTCDWRVRPLTEEMIRYARYDVHFLVELRWLMMRDLVRDQFWCKSTTLTEDRLAAQSMKNLVDDMVRVEDGINDEIKKDVFDVMKSPNFDMSDMEDDTQSFKTSLEVSKDDDAFYTPQSSVRNMSYLSDDGLDDPEDGTKDDITVAQLRVQPLLMTCLSTSQERCRDIWSDETDRHFKNSLYNSLITRWRKNEVSWHPSSTELYDDLYRWRARVAKKFECLPGLISPTDLLVQIAWKRPTTKMSLRRINFQLPDFLEDNEDFLEQVFDMVLHRSLAEGHGHSPTSSVYFYSNLEWDPNKSKKRDRGLGLFEPDGGAYGSTLFKLAVAGVLGAAIGAAIGKELSEANDRHQLLEMLSSFGAMIGKEFKDLNDRHQLSETLNSFGAAIGKELKDLNDRHRVSETVGAFGAAIGKELKDAKDRKRFFRRYNT